MAPLRCRLFQCGSWTFAVMGLLVPSALAAQVARLDVQPRQVTVGVNERFEVLAIAEDRSGNILSPTFQWAVANPAIAKVEEDEAVPGVAFVIGLTPGETMVDVSVGDLTQRISITVEGAVYAGPQGTGVATMLQIQPATVYLMPAEDVQLLPLYLKNDGTPAQPEPVTWRSFRPDVATVDPTGLVVAITEGTGLVEVGTESGLSHRVQVQVAQVPWAFRRDLVALAPTESDTVRIAAPEQENRVLAPRYFTWQSTDPNVAIVSPLGVITAIQGGETEIVATGFGEQRRVPVNVHKAVVGWIVRAYSGDTITVPVGGTAPFVVVGEAADGTPVPEAPVFWSVGDTSLAEFGIAADTLVTGKSVGRTPLVASGADGVIRQWVLDIVAAGLVFDVDRAGVGLNGQVTIAASFADADGTPVAPANRLTWTSFDTTIARVTDGVVTPVGVGPVQIVATTPWDNADTAVVYVQGSLVFTTSRSGNSDIYAAVPTEPGTAYPLITDASQDLWPSFSPDGTRIAFASDRVANLEIYVANADGTDPVRLTQSSAEDRWPRWTPDGSQIVWESTGPSGVPQIWIMRADGSDPRELTSGNRPNRQPAVSPSGQIAFSSGREGNDDVFLMNLDGSNQRNFTATPDTNETMPAWLADSTIFFLQEPDRRDQMTRAVASMNFQRERVAVTQERQLTSFAISPDGAFLAMVVMAPGATGGMVGRMFVIPQDGSQPWEIARQGDIDGLGNPAFRR